MLVLAETIDASKEVLNERESGILFTGAHHARELTSIQMNVYILLKTLHSYAHQEP